MADIKTFVKKVVREMLKVEYPHVCKAASVTAVVKHVTERNDGLCSYTLRITDAEGREDMRTPEIPGLVSDKQFHPGTLVVLLYVNGSIPYITGRWNG